MNELTCPIIAACRDTLNLGHTSGCRYRSPTSFNHYIAHSVPQKWLIELNVLLTNGRSYKSRIVIYIRKSTCRILILCLQNPVRGHITYIEIKVRQHKTCRRLSNIIIQSSNFSCCKSCFGQFLNRISHLEHRRELVCWNHQLLVARLCLSYLFTAGIRSYCVISRISIVNKRIPNLISFGIGCNHSPKSRLSESVKWYMSLVCVGCGIYQNHIHRCKLKYSVIILLFVFNLHCICRRGHRTSRIQYLHTHKHIATCRIVGKCGSFVNSFYSWHSHLISCHACNEQTNIIYKPTGEIRCCTCRSRNNKSELNFGCTCSQCRIQIKYLISPIRAIQI